MEEIKVSSSAIIGASLKIPRDLRLLRNAIKVEFDSYGSLDSNRVVEANFKCKSIWIGPTNCSSKDLVRNESRNWITVLYIHGGGYVSNSAMQLVPILLRFLDILYKEGGIDNIRFLSPEYPLAPENPFPAAPDFVLEVFRDLCIFLENKPVCVGGDSAGGGLALSLCHSISRDGSLSIPTSLLLFSPFVEMQTTAKSYKKNKNTDSLSAQLVDQFAIAYSGVDARTDGMQRWTKAISDPRISPLREDDFRRYPGRALVIAGENEVFLDDILNWCEKAKKFIELEVHVEAKMWHIYPIMQIGGMDFVKWDNGEMELPASCRTAIDKLIQFFK
ncbi:hypothetical protein HK098_004514 [Nowakowskiella sp. JEL0407]|nr:hypothetical protein HK098_004514 [Nowakowskiella sp. JEL0407]